MVDIYFHTNKVQPKEYTTRLIKRLLERNGVTLVDTPAQSDAVFVSLCDITEFNLLWQAKAMGRPIVAGGFMADMPVVQMTADYTCLGECYGFIEALGQVDHLEEIAELLMVATPVKAATPDQEIRWELNPIIPVTKTAHYYYCGKGCPQHCKFCYISHQRKYQQAPQSYIIGALRSIPTKAKLYPMVSHWDYQIPDGLSSKLGILDVRIRDYVRAGGVGYGSRVRAGIEFFSPELRRKLAKPISQDEIAKFVELTKRQNCQSVWYFIGGLEDKEQALEFIAHLPPDSSLRPQIKCVFTYIDPQPMTPMAGFDIREKREFDGQWFFREAQKRNRRVRVNTVKYIAHSTWRTLMQRVGTVAERDLVWGWRNERDNEKLLSLAEKHVPHMVGGTSLTDMLTSGSVHYGPAIGADSCPAIEVEVDFGSCVAVGARA